MDSSTDKQQRQSKKKIVFSSAEKNKTNKTNHLSERSIILYRPFWKNQKIKTNRKEHTVCYNIAKTEDTCREKPSKAQNVSYLT